MIQQRSSISVIMPTYNQGAFISRAIVSLQLQTFKEWELIIINDGSTDYTKDVVTEYLADCRIKYVENKQNLGLGKCLNIGLGLAKSELISYLPSDDLYFSNHLEVLVQTIEGKTNAVLAYSGAQFNHGDNHAQSYAQVSLEKLGLSIQLVQVIHKKTEDKWIERDALVTDDLNRMFWSQLASRGFFVPTLQVTCEWINHPAQRHKLIRETLGGGIYMYKQFYGVKQHIKFQSSDGGFIDEFQDNKLFRRKVVSVNESPLKILLVGELAFNPERILAFEEEGHKLYGLWINSPGFYNAVGPLPFGNVEDISSHNWVAEIKKIKPDIIYALLNYQAVIFAHQVLLANLGIPIVWHFKEGPFFCRQKGIWKELVELYVQSDGQIYINPEIKSWFHQFISETESCSFILDGDLPKKELFQNEKSELLSKSTGEIHTVVPGRPYGLRPKDVQELAKQKIHLHMYGNFHAALYKAWVSESRNLAGDYFHVHPTCMPANWTIELSKYDAGWLHYFKSENGGELMKATWNDLNYPARISTLAAAGLPMLQRDNTSHIVACQSLTERLGMGIFFSSIDELGWKLRDEQLLSNVRENVWKGRMIFTFDHHVTDLILFFKEVIAKCKQKDQAEIAMASTIVEHSIL